MALVGTIIAAAALVGAAIAVMAVLVQRLRQRRWLVQWLRRHLRWRRDWGGVGVGAVIAVMVAFVQGLWRRQHQRSVCGVGVGAVIVAAALVVAVIVVAAPAQRLRGHWRSDCSGDSVGAAIKAAAMLGFTGTCQRNVTMTRQCRQNWVTSHMSATFLGGISCSHVSSW